MKKLQERFVDELRKEIEITENIGSQNLRVEDEDDVTRILMDIILKFRKGFEEECKEALIDKLEVAKEDLEDGYTEGMSLYELQDTFFEVEFLNGTRTFSTSKAERNLICWAYENSDLYSGIEMDSISVPEYKEEQELFFINEGVRSLFNKGLDDLKIYSEEIISEEILEKLIKYFEEQ